MIYESNLFQIIILFHIYIVIIFFNRLLHHLIDISYFDVSFRKIFNLQDNRGSFKEKEERSILRFLNLIFKILQVFFRRAFAKIHFLSLNRSFGVFNNI